MIRIGLVDDHFLIREGMRLLLQQDSDFKVVFEASNGIEALQFLEELIVDILIVDIHMPYMDGFETVSKVREKYSDVKVLVLTQVDGKASVTRMLSLDVHGYYIKSMPPKGLINALRQLKTEGHYFESRIIPKFFEMQELEMNSGNRVSIDDPCFTKQQIKVLYLSAKSLNSFQIAFLLHVSKRTVDRHKENMMKQLNVRNFTSVVLYALEKQWIKVKNEA